MAAKLPSTRSKNSALHPTAKGLAAVTATFAAALEAL
jgi:hypothetical protein